MIKQISGGNRDPKVFWHEPTRQWVLVLYVEAPGKLHTIHFFNSPNLKDWKLASATKGGIDGDKYLFECPDFFELAVDGDVSKKKWILTAANSEYAIGTFDGATFTPEVSRLTDVRGIGFYAAQTFSDIPTNRRIQIGWSQAPSPGMSFNQLQTLPCELTLRTTPDGIRLRRESVKELEALRVGSNQADSLANFRSELIELRAEIDPKQGTMVEFNLRGAKISYDPKEQVIIVNDHRAPAPLVNGKQKLVIFVDRTMLEVFASDGLTYVPMPFIPNPQDQSVVVNVHDGGIATKIILQVYKLRSSWTGK